MVARGETGPLSFIHGYYLQDWMRTRTSIRGARILPKGGTSSALGDIGSHWCDLAEHVAGSKIVSVLADLTTVVPVRYSSGASAEAFCEGRRRGNRQPRGKCGRSGKRAAPFRKWCEGLFLRRPGASWA